MLIRSIRPADEAAYLNILDRTSDDDRYFRFFRAIDRFDHRDLLRFVETSADTIGLIAEEAPGPLGTAHAFVAGEVAEFSVVVAADARRRGVAQALVERLFVSLHARGVRAIVAFSRAENVGFERLARRLGMTPTHAPGDGGVVTWSLELANGAIDAAEATAA